MQTLFQSLDDTGKQQVCAKELDFLTTCLATNPKSYGVWHQRQWIMDAAPQPPWATELDNCTKFLLLDERNFHCWDYRRFVVSRSPEPDATAGAEFGFTLDKISENFSNYSAWHYRSTLLPKVHAEPSAVNRIQKDALDEGTCVCGLARPR